MSEDDGFGMRAQIERRIANARQGAPAQAQVVKPEAPARKPQPVHETTKPIDLVALGKKRLRVVKSELKQLRAQVRKLDKEETQLSRLLDAADGKTVAPVRSIRAARAQER